MTRRRRRWLTALLIVAGLVAFVLWRLPYWSAGLVARRLTEFFQRPVTVAQVRIRLLPLEFEILDLRVAGARPGAPPFLEVPRAVVAPTFESLFSSRLVLARLRIEQPVLRVNAYPEGGDDIPKTKPGTGRGTEVRIRRLTVDRADFHLDHRRVPLNLDLPDFDGRLFQRRGGVLAGRLAFKPGMLQFGTGPPLQVGTDMQVSVEKGELIVEKAKLQTADKRLDLEYTGRITLARRPLGRFQLQGPVDMEVLERHVMRTGFGIRGAGHWDGTLEVEGPRLRLDGKLSGSAGTFDDEPIPRFALHVRMDETGIHLRDIDVLAFGGQGLLQIEIPKGRDVVVTLDGTYQAVDAEQAFAWIFDIGVPGVAATATGDVSLRWPKGRFRALSGQVAFDMTSTADGRTPLSGHVEWRGEDGIQLVEKADLRTPATRARVAGRIGLDERVDLAVDGESTDLAATDDLLTRLRRALGAAEAVPAGFSGSGVFRGRWRGTLTEPVFEGRFSGQDVGYLGVTWGRAEWAGVLDPVAVRSNSLVVRRSGAELWLDGRTETGYYGENDAVDVRLRLTGWPSEDLVKALAWDVELKGPVSGEATVGGRRSAPAGQVRVRSPAGSYYGIPFADLEVVSAFSENVTRVREGRARVGGGRVAFQGTVTDDAVYDGHVDAWEVDVADVIPEVRSGVRWGGRVSGQVTLQGTLDHPRVRASFRSPRLFLGDEGVGAVEATLRGAGDGKVALDANCRSPRVDLRLTGTLGAGPPYLASLRVVGRETSVDPFLRAVAPGLPPGLTAVASGEARIDGSVIDPADLRVAAEASDLALQLTDYPIRSVGPVRASLDAGRLQLQELHLAGEGTDLTARGAADLLGDGPLQLGLRGAADLSVVSIFTRLLRGRGAARLTVDVSGTRAEPRLRGELALLGAGLRVRGFPHGLEDLRGALQFTEEAAHLEGVSGTLAGGSLELEGQVVYPRGRRASFDITGFGRGLALRYPEGLRSVVDGELRYFGDPDRQWVTGRVNIRDAVWTRRYDVASELLAARAGVPGPATVDEGVRYDVKVSAPGTLRIANNLATLQARADLALQGSYGAPVILGRAEIERGQVYFQGNTYLIRRGSIDFANPQRIDPLFDIEGEARIRTYRVTLKLNGTLERVYPTLTSDPPLTAVQILSLLAGADEATVGSLSQVQSDQARLAAAGAATLAAGRIAEEVGLERGVERLFGLDRFSIDPSVMRGGVTNPTARVTVGKRLAPNLNVLYSVDLRGTEERLVSVEYHLSDRFSLLLTRSDIEGYGFDLRLRHHY